MESEARENSPQVGAMKKRRVVMADGKRYLIYYTFENAVNAEMKAADEPNESEARQNV